MVQTHYPAPLKTILKGGAIAHLLFIAGAMLTGWTRQREYIKNAKPRRKFYRAGPVETYYQVRDERFRESIRPLLDWQPNDAGSRYSKLSRSL
mmetsp:Transcript_2130/g.5284  ORF Transcript_2130/g.5284 Transcript_2130/m.5284 type:complete len:93 (-) Transcript_2130:1837-2115(-)